MESIITAPYSGQRDKRLARDLKYYMELLEKHHGQCETCNDLADCSIERQRELLRNKDGNRCEAAEAIRHWKGER